MSFLSVDDYAYGIGNSRNPLSFQKTGATMEAAGVMHSKAYEAGVPGAFAAPSPGLNGAALTSDPTPVVGQLDFVKAAAGAEKRLAGFEATVDRAGALLLLDRLWHNSGIVPGTTGAQGITPAAIPARDSDGAALGNGLRVALEVSGATGNGSPITTITISYTNEANVSGRTGTIPSFPATAAVGTFVPFNLQAGDRGVRSIQSITLGTTLVSGTVHLIIYRHLARIGFRVDGGDTNGKAWDNGGSPRLYDGTVPFLAWIPRDTTAVNISSGEILYAEK